MTFDEWTGKPFLRNEMCEHWTAIQRCWRPECNMRMAWNAAMNEAARIAEAFEVKWHAEYKNAGANRADPHREGMSDGATVIAQHIRAKIVTKGGGHGD